MFQDFKDLGKSFGFQFPSWQPVFSFRLFLKRIFTKTQTQEIKLRVTLRHQHLITASM